MNRLEETSVADVLRWLSRFGPWVALVAMTALVVGFVPDDDEAVDTATGDVATELADDSGGSEVSASPGTIAGGQASATDVTTGTASPSTGSRTSTGGVGSPAGSGAATGTGGGGAAAATPSGGSGLVPNCDPNTGRISVPSTHAPPCVPAYDGDNGGGTYKGVTGDTIKVAVFRPQENPAANAILAAAGADDSEEETRQQYQEWVDLYEAHYETYGRSVELHFVEASGGADDDAAARADAIKVADEIGAFASWGYPNNTYIDELAARGVMCFGCAIQQPKEYFEKNAPYVWSTLMTSTALYGHLTEWFEKQLWGKPAEYAGDALIAAKPRAFGLLWYETPDGAYKAGTEYFLAHMKANGMRIHVHASFRGYPDLAANQEQARPLIQKMKEAGATSIIMAADPFAPIFFSQEATRQNYFPEWIITGSALTDTTFFARTYDPLQWSNAFGLGLLTARVPQEQGGSYRLFHWHYGREPTAAGGYAVIRAPIDIFYNGVHMAGERLTPDTLREGLFSMPVTGRGGITIAAVSYGRQVNPFDDYTGPDDVTYIWWDPEARGEDELGADGVGMYRYVNMGKRYLPGEHPSAAQSWFDPANTVTVYDEPPPSDRPPEYPPPRRS